MKIYSAKESSIVEIRATLFRNGISTTTKAEYQPYSTDESTENILGLYIDSDQEIEAKAILEAFINRQSA